MFHIFLIISLSLLNPVFAAATVTKHRVGQVDQQVTNGFADIQEKILSLYSIEAPKTLPLMQAWKSTFMIAASTKDQKAMQIGSAYLTSINELDTAYFVTSKHFIFDNCKQGCTIQLYENATYDYETARLAPARGFVVFRNAEVVALSSYADLALIKVEKVKRYLKHFQPIRWYQCAKLEKGMAAYAIGHPSLGTKYPEFTDAKIVKRMSRGAILSVSRDATEKPSNSWWMIDVAAEIIKGQSGGPVVNSDGELIGVTASGLMESVGGQIVPCEYVRKFLHEHI